MTGASRTGSDTAYDWHGRTVFVTGGTGFVGSHLVEELLRRGARVRCLVRTDPKWLDGLPVDVIEGTLHTPEALKIGVGDAHVVLHMAGRTRAPERSAFIRDNVEGTLHLMQAAGNAPTVEHTVVASSLAAVGSGGSGIVDESAPLRPVSDYGYSKAQMEEVLQTWIPRLPLTIIRPPAVYGPRETDILTFFQSVARGLCPIVGDGAQPSLSLVFADDLVRGILRSVGRKTAFGQTYFMGGPCQVAWNDVRNATAQVLGRRVLTLRVPRSIVPVVGAVSEWFGKLTGTYPPLNREKAREILQAALMCSSEKASRDLGYAPATDLEHGIQETLAWYQARNWL